MEQMNSSQLSRGVSMHSDTNLRLAKRPTASSSTQNNIIFHDMGTTQYQKGPKPTHNPRTYGAKKGRTARVSTGPDDIDFLSQESRDAEKPTPPEVSKYETHGNLIKNMKFKRKPKMADGEVEDANSNSQRSETPSSSTASSSKAHVGHSALENLSGNENKLHSNPVSSRVASRPLKKKEAPIKPVVPPRRARQPQEFPLSLSPPGRLPSPDPKGKGKAKADRTPSPKPLRKGKARTNVRRIDSEDPSPPTKRNTSRAPRSSQDDRDSSSDSDIEVVEEAEEDMQLRKNRVASRRKLEAETEEDDTPRNHSVRRSKKAKPAAPFPEIEPLSGAADSDDEEPDKRPKPPTRKAQPFPLADSPLARPSTPPHNGKGKQKAEENYPMPSPLAKKASKTSFPTMSPLSSPVHGNPKMGSPVKMSRSMGSLYEDREDILLSNDDSLLIDSTVDPSTLCPYCDEPLPPSPTPHLQSLLAAAKRKSYPEPRPGNPRGLKAPLPTFITICQRHQFEALEMPKAKKRGWPTSIDFSKLRSRGREESMFWNHVVKEVQAMGSRAVVGVKGQFDSFSKTQPGYYGELGSMVIHQTIYNLFPPSSFDADSISPLTPTEFIQRVLVPEAALALIMEDMGFDRDHAAITMRESAAYGVAMFPDSGDGDGLGHGAGVGEDIVRERARARRKELEVEERVEEKMLKEAQQQVAKPRPRMIRKRHMDEGSATETDSTADGKGKIKRKKLSSESDEAAGGSTPRRGAVNPAVTVEPKTKTSTALGKGKPPMSVNSRATRRSASVQMHTDEDSDTLVPTTGKEKAKASVVSDDDEVQIVAPPAEAKSDRPRPRPVNRSTISLIDDDDNTEATPRPRRTRPSSRDKSDNESTTSKAAFCPLQAARNRQGSTTIPDQPDTRKRSQWRKNLGNSYTMGPGSSSDEIEARSSPPSRMTKRKGKDSWLLSDSLSSSP
ncbi:hypothetical protein EVG20_g543 [Dentipellis fragilis]|uniref:Restriction of telomere capping protein 4 n=1 Tax=Dentipellis fragilis TaxID=205917 RepID=A0A4Y9ZCA1_9AGAM|nr:hypothetical protein EVG20_g543 [Dentipellis fragilis]